MTDTIARADRVKHLLENPDLKQAFVDVKSAIHAGIDELKTSQVQELVKFKERLHLLESVEANLMRAIEDGKLERYFEQERAKLPHLGDIVKWRMKRRA